MSKTLEEAILAVTGRLANLLNSLPGEPLGGGVEFLRAQPVPSAGAGPDRLSELGFSEFDAELTALAGLADEHEGFSAIFRRLHPSGEPRPTAGLAAQLFVAVDRCQFRTALESAKPLRWGFIELSGAGPYFERSLTVANGVWPALRGAAAWPSGWPHEAGPVPLAGLEEWLQEPAVLRAIQALRGGEPCTVVVSAAGEELAHERGLALVQAAGLTAAGVADARLTAEQRGALWAHCLVRRAIPVVLVASDGPAAAAPPPSFEGYPGAAVLCGRDGAMVLRCSRPVLSLHAERLLPAARRRMWEAALPGLTAEQVGVLATYTIEPARAAELAADMTCLSRLEGRTVEPGDLPACLRARAASVLAAGVKLIRPQARWGSLVLSRDREELLRESVNRLAYQERVFDQWGVLRDRAGVRGVRMLFSGPPGTGKTYSAEVLAHELGRDLLLVDISRVVSKWIGETEKNLASIFDAAERSHAVCFFDEADALFGRRTEVSDAHDRNANLETAYLLSRLDRFEGLAILATNLRQNIDPAFLRRMEFVVDFHEPDREERARLWRNHIPDAKYLEADVNLHELASLYAVAGGFIRNAAVAAAFMAAADGGRISRHHLFRAVRREYTKAGRPFPGVPAGTRV